MKFYYGADGLTAFESGGNKYFYQKNIFGDIIGIYDNNFNWVARYVYDAWGNCKVVDEDGSELIYDPNSIAYKNPFRYRGYYFDRETGFYYLQSRYYDPQMGRFISPDHISYLDPTTINGLNLYAYCNNNPVMRLDPSGYVWWLIGATIGFIATVISDFDDDKKIFNRSKTLSDYSYNATLGVGLNFITTVLGLEVGVVAYGASAFAELIATSFLDKSDVKYNGKKEIKNSYKVLGIGDKVKYIRENNISENTGMSEFALWFEWTYHNIAYYLDIFGILREHSRDVNFG